MSRPDIIYCKNHGCGRRADVVPKILVWGNPKRDHPPAVIRNPERVVCHRCRVQCSTNIGYFLTTSEKKRISALMAQGKFAVLENKAVPDWSTARLRFELLPGRKMPEKQ